MVDEIRGINVLILLMNGKYDTAQDIKTKRMSKQFASYRDHAELLPSGTWIIIFQQDKVVKPFSNKIPKVWWAQFLESSHTAHLETEREWVMGVVIGFLIDTGIIDVTP
ncbi:hypothetical protein Clacol_005231 [Clathrus columnatus]|uniref:Uncharacterized protein n=1 Tax=Clathrus columnatus TaxID=1419009 RepID=A0AAV5ABC6_9AGAM|nr:hypothetical protein Clacol_005231 [Clathrus columnatus]